MAFLDLQMFTFSNLMESNGREEGEIEDLSEKMERDLRREGSIKDGESRGLVITQKVIKI